VEQMVCGCIDIRKARQILDREHYGLASVKDRILEYLSVRKLNPRMKGPILCFVGPPGWARLRWDRPLRAPSSASSCAFPWEEIRDEAEIRAPADLHRRYAGPDFGSG